MIAPSVPASFPSPVRFALVASLVTLLGAVSASGGTLAEGFGSTRVTVAPAGNFVGGLDFLPGGHWAVFDGDAVQEIDPADGSVIRTIFTPPTAVFGSFVRLHPDGQTLFFGESSTGTIYRIDLAGGNAQPVTILPFNFDLAVDPLGQIFVSAAAPPHNVVYLLDPANGDLDEIVRIDGPSGPILFDDQGNLYLGQPDGNWPPTPGASRILRFEAADVDGVIGQGFLDESDATEYVTDLDGVFGMVFDDQTDILVTDAFYGTLIEARAAGGPHVTLYETGGAAFPSYIAYADEPMGLFAPFQPEGAGQMAVFETDFFSFNDGLTIRPARPVLDVTPASPVPPGGFTIDLTAGPSGGVAFLTAATAAIDPELPVWVGGLPLYFGLDLSTLFAALALPLDTTGAASLPATNPGTGGLSVIVQMTVLTGGTGPLGTSNPLEIVLQ